MAVYTQLSREDVHAFLAQYEVGDLSNYKGIESGVENTNYFVDTRTATGEQGRYVLTLFEYLPAETLPFFTDLTDLLASHQLPVPAAIRDREGRALKTLKGKPALLQPCLPGAAVDLITSSHCAAVGDILARIHLAGQQDRITQDNQRGIAWLRRQQERMIPLMPRADGQLLQATWQKLEDELFPRAAELPTGLIHGDLFHDNVLFSDYRITGVIDFYNACTDWLLYDLAVTVNDWCNMPRDVEFDPMRLDALLRAYAKVRPFTAAEKELWPLVLQLAATRFWISRLYTFVLPEEGNVCADADDAVRGFKDPDEFRDLLIDRIIASKTLSGRGLQLP